MEYRNVSMDKNMDEAQRRLKEMENEIMILKAT